MPTNTPTWDESEAAPSWEESLPDLSQVGPTPYDRYKLAVSEGATPENFSEIPGLSPSQNPDWDFTRETGGGAPGLVAKGIKLIGDKVIEPIAAQIFTSLKQATAVDIPVTEEQRGKGVEALDLKPIEPGAPMLKLPRLTPQEMEGATPGEKVAAGIGEGLSQTIEGFSTPGGVATLPFAEFKPVRAYYGAQMAAGIPDSLKAISEAETPQDTARAYTSFAANLGMGALLAHSALKGGPRAGGNAKATEVHGDVRSQPIDVEAQVPPAESGQGVQSRTAQEAQVPLSYEHAELLAPHMTDEGHVLTKLDEGRVMRANHETGQVDVDPEQFSKWVDNDLKDLSPKEKATAIKSAFEHEDIHLKTDPEDAEPFWDSMSPFEQFALKRQYLKGQDPANFTTAQLGFEAIRNRIERAMGMDRSDFVGMALHERWTAQALDHLAHIVGKLRSLKDSELSAHQKSILDKVRENINAARNAVEAGAGAANEPFMVRKEDEPAGTPNAFKVPTDMTKAAKPLESEGISTHNLDDLESELPATAPGERVVLVRRPDGSIYRAAYSGKQYDVSAGGKAMIDKYGSSKVDSIGTVNERGQWTHSLLPKGHKIIKGFSPYAAVERSGEAGPAMLRKKGKAGEQEEFFPAVTKKGVPGGEDVQATSARQAGATEFKPEQKVFAQDVWFENPSESEGAQLPYRPISPTEAKDPTELKKILTSEARVGGSDLPVSMTRRLTALFDKRDGTVHLVSTYPGDGTVRLVDPALAGKERPSRPVEEIIPNYEPFYSILLREPRQNFHQKFNSMADFQEMFHKDARELAREHGTGYSGIPQGGDITSVDAPGVRESEVPQKGLRLSTPFSFPGEKYELPRPTTAELKDFHNFFGDVPPSDAQQWARRIERTAATASRSMISGLRKLTRIVRAQHRGMSEGDALGHVLDQLYENFTHSETRTDFVQRTMAQSRASTTEENASVARRLLAQAEREKRSGARNLSTLRDRPPTVVAGAKPGVAPEMTEALTSREPVEMLSPEDRAKLDAEIEKEHNIISPERSSELLKSILDSPTPKERYRIAGTNKTIEQVLKEPEPDTEGEVQEGDQTPSHTNLEIFPEREMESATPARPGSTESLKAEKKVVAKAEGAKGQLDFFKKQGPAMLRKVEDTAEKVKDYLARTGANVKSAGDLSDQLYRLKTSEKADYDLALPVIKSALKIIPEADRPALLQYADEMQVLKKSNVKLTDAQHAMYETFIEPLLNDNQRMYKALQRAGIPVGESTYLGRIVQDTHSLYSRLWSGTKQRITEGSLLGQGASFFKRRVFKALEDDKGNRQLIALVGDGKDTRVIGYENGKGELLGKMPPESLEPRPLTAQQIRTQRIVEARRLQELDKLDKEEQLLLKEKDRLTKIPGTDPAILKELDARLASINGDYAEVGEKYPSPVFDIPRMWKDKGGKVWKLTDATVNEIEKNTNTRYYQEPMSGVITQNLKLKQIYRANQFLEDLKNSSDFKRISRSVNERNVPTDWRTVDLPQFRGLRIEPHTADVLDLFAQESKGPSLPMKYVTKLTNFLRNALFVWNPFVHEPNLLAHWFTARGIEWGKPLGYDRMVKSGVAALHDVMTRSQFRDQALRAGAPLMRGMGDINNQVMKLLRKELDPDPSLATKIARGLGYINPLRMIRAFGDSLTWGTNEVLTLQLIRETMDRTGLSMEDAISEVGKHMPNYRIPPRVLNSRLIAHIMRNPLLTLWGHYHYGALRSYGEMGKEIFSPKSTMGQRMEGLGRVATIGVLMAVAYPVIDDLVNKIMKTKGLKMRRAGSATFPQGVLDVVRQKKTPEALGQSVLTPSPVTQGAFELAFNRNLRSGLPIYERRLGTQTAKDLGTFAAQKISPVEEATKVFGGKKSGAEFGLGLAGVTRTRVDSAMAQFGRMADNWMRTNPDESIREEYKRRTQDVFQESEYQLLRSAVIRSDERSQQMAVEKLLKTRKPEEVAQRIKQWQDSPFTGTRKTDKALMAEMTPKDWDLWYQAAQERLDIADGMRNALVDSLVKPKE